MWRVEAAVDYEEAAKEDGKPKPETVAGNGTIEERQEERGGAHRADQDRGHLISYALEEYDLLLDERGQPYASKKEGATNIAVPLDSLRHPLAARYYDENDAPASTSAWPEAAQTLHGLALRHERQTIYLRHGHVGRDDLVIDLGHDDGQCVAISGAGGGRSRGRGPDQVPSG